MSAYLKIEWLNSVDFGSVLYQDGFKNRIYLDVELERPDYNVTLESDTNGDNQEIPKFKKWEKVYKFTCWMQEDLVDAFTFMSVVDTIEVTPQTDETLIVQEGSMRVEPEWEEAGCLAKTTVSFVTDYAAGGSCTENMDKTCLCSVQVAIDLKMDSASFLGFPVAPGDRVFVYSTEHIADTKFTAIIYYGKFRAHCRPPPLTATKNTVKDRPHSFQTSAARRASSNVMCLPHSDRSVSVSAPTDE